MINGELFHGARRTDPQGNLFWWDDRSKQWRRARISTYKAPLKGRCIHRGNNIGLQRCAGCQARKPMAMVFECDIYERATEKRKVLLPDSRRPDKTVAICLGCPELSDDSAESANLQGRVIQ